MYKDADFLRDIVFICILVLMTGIAFEIEIIKSIQKNNSEAIDGLYTIAKLHDKAISKHTDILVLDANVTSQMYDLIKSSKGK